MKLKKKEDLGIRIGGHIVLVLLTALAILPFWLLISASFSDPAYATREGYRFFPAELSLEAYQYIFQQWAQIGRAYGVDPCYCARYGLQPVSGQHLRLRADKRPCTRSQTCICSLLYSHAL